MTDDRRALVLFSGGQDSATCLAWALDCFASVETIGFDYGQVHRIELDCRDNVRRGIEAAFPKWRDRLGADHLVDASLIGGISDTALTRAVAIQSAIWEVEYTNPAYNSSIVVGDAGVFSQGVLLRMSVA